MAHQTSPSRSYKTKPRMGKVESTIKAFAEELETKLNDVAHEYASIQDSLLGKNIDLPTFEWQDDLTPTESDFRNPTYDQPKMLASLYRMQGKLEILTYLLQCRMMKPCRSLLRRQSKELDWAINDALSKVKQQSDISLVVALNRIAEDSLSSFSPPSSPQGTEAFAQQQQQQQPSLQSTSTQSSAPISSAKPSPPPSAEHYSGEEEYPGSPPFSPEQFSGEKEDPGSDQDSNSSNDTLAHRQKPCKPHQPAIVTTNKSAFSSKSFAANRDHVAPTYRPDHTDELEQDRKPAATVMGNRHRRNTELVDNNSTDDRDRIRDVEKPGDDPNYSRVNGSRTTTELVDLCRSSTDHVIESKKSPPSALLTSSNFVDLSLLSSDESSRSTQRDNQCLGSTSRNSALREVTKQPASKSKEISSPTKPLYKSITKMFLKPKPKPTKEELVDSSDASFIKERASLLKRQASGSSMQKSNKRARMTTSICGRLSTATTKKLGLSNSSSSAAEDDDDDEAYSPHEHDSSHSSMQKSCTVKARARRTASAGDRSKSTSTTKRGLSISSSSSYSSPSQNVFKNERLVSPTRTPKSRPLQASSKITNRTGLKEFKNRLVREEKRPLVEKRFHVERVIDTTLDGPAIPLYAAAPRWHYHPAGWLHEEHGKAVYNCVWSTDYCNTKRDDGSLSTLWSLATCGANQVSLYEVEVWHDKKRGMISGPFLLKQCYADSDSHEEFFALAFAGRALSSDGTQVLCTGGKNRCINVYDTGTGKRVRQLKGHGGSILALKTCPTDDRLLASSSQDLSVRLWNLIGGSTVAILIGHRERVIQVAWNDSATRLASCSMDTTVKIWDLSGYVIQHAISKSHEITQLANDDGVTVEVPPILLEPCFSTTKVHLHCADGVEFLGDMVISKSVDSTIEVWLPDYTTPENPSNPDHGVTHLHTFKYRGGDLWYMSFAIDPSRSRIAVGNTVGEVYVWNMTAETTQTVVACGRSRVSVRCVDFSPCGNVLVASLEDGTVHKWDVGNIPTVCEHEDSCPKDEESSVSQDS